MSAWTFFRLSNQDGTSSSSVTISRNRFEFLRSGGTTIEESQRVQFSIYAFTIYIYVCWWKIERLEIDSKAYNSHSNTFTIYICLFAKNWSKQRLKRVQFSLKRVHGIHMFILIKKENQDSRYRLANDFLPANHPRARNLAIRFTFDTIFDKSARLAA